MCPWPPTSSGSGPRWARSSVPAGSIAEVEGNFPELTLEVGRRHRLDDVVVVEWTCNYGDGRLYRNVTIGELEDGEAVRVTDYWGEPTSTPEWRVPMTDRLDMPADGIWPDERPAGPSLARGLRGT